MQHRLPPSVHGGTSQMFQPGPNVFPKFLNSIQPLHRVIFVREFVLGLYKMLTIILLSLLIEAVTDCISTRSFTLIKIIRCQSALQTK